MEAVANLKYLRISPRKVKIVADLIRGKSLELNLLECGLLRLSLVHNLGVLRKNFLVSRKSLESARRRIVLSALLSVAALLVIIAGLSTGLRSCLGAGLGSCLSAGLGSCLSAGLCSRLSAGLSAVVYSCGTGLHGSYLVTAQRARRHGNADSNNCDHGQKLSENGCVVLVVFFHKKFTPFMDSNYPMISCF